jgi:hypothetical protein
MNVSRVISIAARRAPVARSSVVADASLRGFAVAAYQLLRNPPDERVNSSRVGVLLAAAAAATSASFVFGSEDRADCCGIAGVVGGSGDAR